MQFSRAATRKQSCAAARHNWGGLPWAFSQVVMLAAKSRRTRAVFNSPKTYSGRAAQHLCLLPQLTSKKRIPLDNKVPAHACSKGPHPLNRQGPRIQACHPRPEASRACQYATPEEPLARRRAFCNLLRSFHSMMQCRQFFRSKRWQAGIGRYHHAPGNITDIRRRRRRRRWASAQ